MADRYEIEYAREAENDIDYLRAYHQRIIIEAVEQHIRFTPTMETQSSVKRMQPSWSQFRLRVDDFRVHYDVDEDRRLVTILRVLEKGTEVTPQAPP